MASDSNKDGTPQIKLGWYFLISLKKFLGEKSGIKIIFIPQHKGVWIQTPNPKPWNIGKIDNIEVPSFAKFIILWHCNASEFKFKFDKSIPLGSPLVPPLYNITAGSFGPFNDAYSPS